MAAAHDHDVEAARRAHATNVLADLPFPRRVRDQLIAEGRARAHHVLPESGWVTISITSPEEAGHAVELFRMAYDRATNARRRLVSSPGKLGIGSVVTREELKQHLDAAAPGGSAEAGRLAALIVGACWPGGPEDRTERAALEWLRHWTPEQVHAELPACSCSTGRCILCN